MFDFLRWPARTLRGVETIKTRRCWVVDFTNPAKSGHHSTVRLFVDHQSGGLMRLNTYNFDGKRTLTYHVQSAKRHESEFVVKTATAIHYQPGSSKELAEVTYAMPPSPRQ